MDVATLVWMLVILKIPIIAALLIIWYAVREPDGAQDEEDGGSRVPREPTPRPDRPGPRAPRRGPHATPPAPAPPRIRTVKGRQLRRPAGR